MKKSIILAIFALSLTLSSCNNEQAKAIDDNKTQEENQIGESVDNEILEADQSKDQENEDTVVLEDMDGNSVSLADYKGEKTYVEFWASWCPICLTGLDQFDQLSKNASDYNIVSVVSPGQLGEMPKEEFIEWFESLGYENMEVLFDTYGSFIDEFDIRSTPTNVFLSSDGQVEKVLPGQMPEEMVKEILAEIS